MAIVLFSPQTQTFIHNSIVPSSCCYLQPTTHISFSLRTPSTSLITKCQQINHSSSLQPKTTQTQEDGIPIEDVKILVKFKSRHNYIRVLEVSRKADHPFRGSRLLLLDGPGNIHSISFLLKTLTETYFDVFATLPPILPPGPLAILGFGAGSTARILLELYPDAVVHGWELDPSVIEVAREFFNLGKLERENKDRLFIYVGNALNASLKDGFSGIMVDLFSKGSLIPELQDPATWKKMKKCLRKGGRIMVNVGGSCVESENKYRDGKVVMEETLKAMKVVFGKKLFVLNLGNRKDDSTLALTGDLPQPDAWKKVIKKGFLRSYVDMWKPYSGQVRAKSSHLAGTMMHQARHLTKTHIHQARHLIETHMPDVVALGIGQMQANHYMAWDKCVMLQAKAQAKHVHDQTKAWSKMWLSD
ncbi:putative S-adenosyl-L-methionine-dependent methyltransferase [Lupinus albus]|uniref:Putative S-adenosyl-L-methionine-dependent methyltransferase n=1 Tax=Lupinus albus TaxID=3870 RepID=A0A6A4Q8A9_LUPAL|nr:putative S-adenosyl-L-methionine-dependent methyltransferase [Lupinus albus]